MKKEKEFVLVLYLEEQKLWLQWHFISHHCNKKREYSALNYFVRENIHITIIKIYCYNCYFISSYC